MPVNPPATLNKGRAILTFALAYIAVTILGIALSLSISAIGHIPQTAEPMQNAHRKLASTLVDCSATAHIWNWDSNLRRTRMSAKCHYGLNLL